MDDITSYLAAWARLPNLGPFKWKKIEAQFENARTAWNATLPEIVECGIKENTAEVWFSLKSTINPEEQRQKLEQENISLISWNDPLYPEKLKNIFDAPPWLFIKGNIESLNNKKTIGVVGTRKITPYGKRVAENITKDLVSNNLCIVSGLALGVDAIAHKVAVDQNGTTIGVLASGLDKENIYPSSNRYLAHRIIETGGALVSEHAIGTPALRHQFPYRNRVISGLSLGSLIIEAPEESGALITAKYALDQNREIFAIPGDIYQKNSTGTNNLIKMGAHLVTSGEDILDVLNIAETTDLKKSQKITPASREESLILETLSGDPVHIDEIIKITRLTSAKVNASLSLMEMSGKIRNLGGMNYVKGR